MFKNKFKELVQKKKELTTISSQILNDKQSLNILGGSSCNTFLSGGCGVYDSGGPNCPRLLSCKVLIDDLRI